MNIVCIVPRLPVVNVALIDYGFSPVPAFALRMRINIANSFAEELFAYKFFDNTYSS